MSIIIQNVKMGDDPLGEATYELRINEKVITTFPHVRSKGLSECLLAAAKAAEKQKWDDAKRIFERLGLLGCSEYEIEKYD